MNHHKDRKDRKDRKESAIFIAPRRIMREDEEALKWLLIEIVRQLEFAFPSMLVDATPPPETRRRD